MIKKPLITLCLLCAVQPAFAAGRGYLGVWFANLPATEKVVQTGVVVNRVCPSIPMPSRRVAMDIEIHVIDTLRAR